MMIHKIQLDIWFYVKIIHIFNLWLHLSEKFGLKYPQSQYLFLPVPPNISMLYVLVLFFTKYQSVPQHLEILATYTTACATLY